jgi:hypothetical protein
MTNRSQLIQVLSQVQNDPAHSNHDILTFAGFCDSEAELANHIVHEFENSLRHMRAYRFNGRRYVKRTKKAA